MRKLFSFFAALTLSIGLWAAAPANVESVDLGLSVKWANMNVGATAPEGYGDYFAWGETEPKDNYGWSTYFDTNDDGSTFQKYNLDGGKTTLDSEDDAAHVKWGGNWRMPTKAELEELQNNCTWTWTTLNNISGYEVKGPNNNTIFLPASGYCFGSSLGSNAGSGGYYWSSSLCESGSSDAYFLLFYPAYMFCYNSNRYYGYSVRPVYVPASAITPVYNTEGDVTSGIARWDTLACADYKVVENATEQVTWGVAGDTTWYVVKDTISLAEGAICVGDVRLILADSAQLTATGNNAGIQVSGTGNSLTIYAQSTGEQMGELVATCIIMGSGIGGDIQKGNSNITINGGKITANGGNSGAGIGGGNGGAGSNITINGGAITATGGMMGAGIGGGRNGTGSNITINGGTVTANGGSMAAGIGGGMQGSGSYITILAGTVTATGGSMAAGIGGGRMSTGSNIFVATTCVVKAGNTPAATTVIENDGTDLASSLTGKLYVTVNTPTVSDLTITGDKYVGTELTFAATVSGFSATPMIIYEVKAGEGEYAQASGGKFTPTATGDYTVKATAFYQPEDGDPEEAFKEVEFTVTEAPTIYTTYTEWQVKYGPAWEWVNMTKQEDGTFTVEAVWGNTGMYIASGTNPIKQDWYPLDDVNVNVEEDVVEGDEVVITLTVVDDETITLNVAKAPAVPVPYIAPIYNTEGDVTSGIARWDTLTCAEYKVVENATEAVTWGVAGDTTWYVVKDTITLAKGAICAGDVRLILADNAKLTATGGINVTGTNSLTIYAQSTGTQMGQLSANSGSMIAGIGGGDSQPGNNITINGGTVEATGGSGAAGIGGGRFASGSNITINGGTVEATGGSAAAGIGGGNGGAGSNITINGGTITANNGSLAAGIGGGNNGAGSNITINGGTITANGGNLAAGIGGGRFASGSNITILAGTVTANGGSNASCIGNGKDAQTAASNIFVATTCLVKADGNNPPTTVIENDGTDLADKLAGKRYATVEKAPAVPVAPANVESVDLGLPSGLKWANMNVGATAPEGYGDYFAWGETEPKDTYDWSTYFDTNDGGSTFTKYNLDGGKTTLDPEDDAAHVKWGGNWRMPTKAELEELQNNCTWTWTTLNNISGYEVKGPNNNTIFLPASGYCFGSSLGSNAGSGGYYWSSSLCESGSSDAYFLLFYPAYMFCYNSNRYYGYSVRPVYAPASAPAVPYITPVYNTEGDVTSGIARWDTLTCAEYKVVENATEQVTWGVAGDTTWYVVKDTISLAKGAICVGDVRLILADSAQLTATGDNDAYTPGIQVSGEGNSLAIYGQAKQIGQLIATGGMLAAGIGGGNNGSGENITINGGTVTATGGLYAAGIGGGLNGSGSNITILAGTVTANGGESGAGIGGGNSGSGSYITILAGTVTATGGDNAAGIGSGTFNFNSVEIFVATSLQVKADGNNPPTTVIENDGTNLADKLASKQYATVEKAAAPVAPAVPYITPVYNTEGDVTSGIARWDTLTCAEYKVVENATEQVTWGVAGNTTWYIVKGTDVQLSKGAVCAGDVRLILADSAQLTATGESQKAGIQVSGEGNSLTIYGQTAQSGQLIANGGESAAGIGGGWVDLGSNITINGGTITATGGDTGAGIGGGYWGEGKNITINGGTVTAIGGENASSIGGGNEASASDIIVATNLLVKADGNNPPTTVIENDGTDLADKLEGKRYAILKALPYDTVSVTVKDTLCYQQLFISRLQSVTPMQDTTFNDTIVKTVYKDSTFRDSIYIYELKVLPDVVIKDAISDKVCYNTDYTWVLPEGNRTIDGYTEAGVKTLFDTVRNSLDCDSIIYTLNLTVLPDVVIKDAESDKVCYNTDYTWVLPEGNRTIDGYTVAGVKTIYDTVRNSLDCDSIIYTLNLTVWSDVDIKDAESDKVCYNTDYTWALPEGNRTIAGYTEAGLKTIFDTVRNSLDCDSIIYTLNLTVWPATVDEPTKYDTILVDNLPYIWSTYTDKTIACYTADTYRDTAYNILGCDSIRYTLELAIIAHDTVTKEIELDLCHGESYTSRKQTVTPYLVGDTTFSDIVPSIMMEPLLMRDSVYAYTIHVQSRYVDELPALVKYDSWLLVVDRKGIEDKGITFTADQVLWYRVEDKVDEYPFGENNDTQIGTGDYYTIASKMSGKYYALIDVDVSWLAPCALYARTVILDCDAPSGSGPKLTPTIVQAGGLMTLSNLSEGESDITVYSASGQLIRTEKVINQTEHEMHAEGITGVYLLQVTNKERNDVFKYVITH